MPSAHAAAAAAAAAARVNREMHNHLVSICSSNRAPRRITVHYVYYGGFWLHFNKI